MFGSRTFVYTSVSYQCRANVLLSLQHRFCILPDFQRPGNDIVGRRREPTRVSPSVRILPGYLNTYTRAHTIKRNVTHTRDHHLNNIQTNNGIVNEHNTHTIATCGQIKFQHVKFIIYYFI